MRRWLFVVLLAWCVDAAAVVVLDQEQPLIGDPPRTYAIGGGVEQILSQTVAAGVTGRLVEVQVPVACRSGELILEIRELDGDSPTGRFLSIDLWRASEFPRPEDPPAWQRLMLSRPVAFNAGDRFAIQLRDKSGECMLFRAPDGDTYPRGEGWFINNTPPTTVWTPQSVTPSGDNDYPFKTFMDVVPERSGPCTVHNLPGGGPMGTPIPFVPAWAPVCRCLQDEGLRESRCAFLDPDLFMIRRVPWPLKEGETFKVRWTVVPLTKLKGVVELTEQLPDGFKSSLKGPLAFFVDQVPPGGSLTLEYEAVAGAKGGKAESSIRFGGRGQVMGTVVEVDR